MPFFENFGKPKTTPSKKEGRKLEGRRNEKCNTPCQ
jgi:hypothetical protein